MPALRSLTIFLLAASSFTNARIVPELRPSPSDTSVGNFQSLLETVQRDGHALRELLSELHPAFGRGVYENARLAIEAVHRDSPALASKVVEMAHNELVKRQSGANGTATTTTLGQGVGVVGNNGEVTGKIMCLLWHYGMTNKLFRYDRYH